MRRLLFLNGIKAFEAAARGGSFAAPERLLRHTFRNFYLPDRGDVFCGFRTCALE